MNYYNEYDPKAAEWLRELIKRGLIPDGFVDERSIELIKASDLRGYDQCHFFAGIGGWSQALKLAGLEGAKGVWTGSCPCQPFSAAGKQLGVRDPRHLWPVWFRLLQECRRIGIAPWIILGEQVATKAALGWFDGVCADMEAEDYTCDAIDFPAASVGSPNIRQRLYWVAYANGRQSGHRYLQRGGEHGQLEENGGAGGMDDAAGPRREGRQESASEEDSRHEARMRMPSEGIAAGGLAVADRERSEAGISGQDSGQEGDAGVANDSGDKDTSSGGADERMGHAEFEGLEGLGGHEDRGHKSGRLSEEARRSIAEAGADGYWAKYDLIFCTDGKARRVEPGTFPLAHGIPGRVGLLRGYGNAINPEQAACFIEACAEMILSGNHNR